MSNEIGKLLDKYGETIVNGLSASVSLKYTSTREAEQARAINSMVDITGFPSMSDLDNVNSTSCGNSKDSKDSQSLSSDPYASTPEEAGRGPSQFDWKTRAKEIEAQVKKRGLTSTDFGIMKENTKVSDNFSWKGYSRMICTRLQATMDPSLPETCGCPPMDWKGWRIST
jgi:hypothetical protein